MSDRPKQRWQTWISWVGALVVIYPLSVFPVALVARWSIQLGIISLGFDGSALETLYQPVLWAIDHSPPLEHGLERAFNSFGAPHP